MFVCRVSRDSLDLPGQLGLLLHARQHHCLVPAYWPHNAIRKSEHSDKVPAGTYYIMFHDRHLCTKRTLQGGEKKRKIWGKEIKWEDTARTPVLLCSACAHCCVERSALALSGPCKRGGHSPACRAVLSSIVPTTHPEGLVPPGAPHMTQSLVFRVHCPQWDSTKSGNKATV